MTYYTHTSNYTIHKFYIFTAAHRLRERKDFAIGVIDIITVDAYAGTSITIVIGIVHVKPFPLQENRLAILLAVKGDIWWLGRLEKKKKEK